MNTKYTPVDRDFLFSLAAAKARGLTWSRLAELTKVPLNDLEVIPWREPKEWAKACKYAEKLVAHEVLAETVASLRLQMNDPVNNGRLKAQIANSLVRIVQTQHALRTPKTPKKLTPIERQTPSPPLTPVATPTPTPEPTRPVAMPTPTPIPTPKLHEAKMGLGTIVAIVLFLFGVLASCMPVEAADSGRTADVSRLGPNSSTHTVRLAVAPSGALFTEPERQRRLDSHARDECSDGWMSQPSLALRF